MVVVVVAAAAVVVIVTIASLNMECGTSCSVSEIENCHIHKNLTSEVTIQSSSTGKKKNDTKITSEEGKGPDDGYMVLKYIQLATRMVGVCLYDVF